MATISKDRRQAKVFDNHLYGEPMIWRRSTRRYEQTHRNNHYAPRVLFSNKRVSAMPGNWGLVVANSAGDGWELCFALEETGLLPEGVGKVLVVSPGCLPYNKKLLAEDLHLEDIPLIYDEARSFAEFKEPLVKVSDMEITRDRAYGWGVHAIWHGEVPADHIEKVEAIARRTGYETACKEVTDQAREIGVSIYSHDSFSEVLGAMSYGYLTASDLPEEPFALVNHSDRTTVYDYTPKDYAPEYRQAFEKARAVISVWQGALDANGISLRSGWLSRNDSKDKLERAIETGRALGYDSYMSAHIVEGIPLADLFA